MKVRVTFIRYYTYEVEGTDLDECLDKAEDSFDSDSRYPVAESGCDDMDYEIIEEGEEDE